MFIILSLIVAIAAFNIAASMFMIVREKDRDIAVLRTLGLSRHAVMLIFLLHGIVIGVAGTVLGIIVGAWGANQADRVVAAIERWFEISLIKPDVYYINYLPADVRLTDIAVSYTHKTLPTIYSV